jgi:flagellar M-ring protein FliF
MEQMNYRRALAGELARTIMSLEAVDRARVHLAIEERSLFTKDSNAPSASVAVKLRPGRELSPPQVKGIVNLVASSVEGLKPERVTLVDEAGAVLWSGDDGVPSTDNQRELERTLARRVSDLLDRIVGRGRSVVVVTAEIDTARTDRTEELYDKDKIAVRSESRVEDRSAADGAGAQAAAGISGARGNLPGSAPPRATSAPGADPTTSAPPDPAAGKGSRTHSSETRNYEVNRIVNHIIGPKLRVSRLHVSVLIDAASTRTTSTASAAAGSPGMKSASLERIAALAQAAAGLDPARGDRIEVESVPFARAPESHGAPPPPADPWKTIPRHQLLIGAGVPILLLAGIAAVALLRGKRKRPRLVQIRGLPVTAGQAEAMLMQGDDGAASQVAALGPSVRERALSAARGDSVRAARVLSAWLAESPAGENAGRQRGSS